MCVYEHVLLHCDYGEYVTFFAVNLKINSNANNFDYFKRTWAVSNLYRDLKGMYFNVFVIYICMYVYYLTNLYIIVWLHNCNSLYV